MKGKVRREENEYMKWAEMDKAEERERRGEKLFTPIIIVILLLELIVPNKVAVSRLVFS